jgi:hypothetical protein
MNHHLYSAGIKRVAAILSLLAVAVCLVPAGAALGQNNIVRVEEDWSLQIGEPDPNSVGPQLITTMSPNENLNGTYFTLEINHRSAPTWTPGGISMHRWFGEARYASFDRADRTVMGTHSETVTWTQSLYVDGGQLYYKVSNGSSSTWGPFGHSNNFKLSKSWDSPHLNGYTPEISVSQSGAAYAGNRIHLLKIVRIRTTLSDGSVLTDNTERIVQQLVQ